MGDGQHVWAAAEWIMIMRNCFAREEHGGRLILCSGLPPEWFKVPVDISMGPMWTSFGAITLHVTADMINVTIAWEAKWHTSPPEIEVHFPGVPVIHTNSKERSVSFGLPQSPNFPV